MLNQKIKDKIKKLISENRDSCLWFLREDYYPEETKQLIHTLGYIERFGNRLAYREARKLKEWLLQNSNKKSVG